MGTMRKARKATNWARSAMKWGLLLTDVALWEAVTRDVKHAATSVGDRVQRRYDGHLEREPEPRVIVKTGPDWFGRTTSLLAGIGIGVGVGLLFAPSSGEQTREAIRDKAEEIKDRVSEAASRTIRFGSSSESAATGTTGY